MGFYQGRNEPVCSIHHLEPQVPFELSHHLFGGPVLCGLDRELALSPAGVW